MVNPSHIRENIDEYTALWIFDGFSMEKRGTKCLCQRAVQEDMAADQHIADFLRGDHAEELHPIVQLVLLHLFHHTPIFLSYHLLIIPSK
eukprot:COSAG05_NODE_3324_length_2149_cov_2.369268_1_plen_90_part_00